MNIATDNLVSLKGPEVRTYPALEFRAVDSTESGRFLEGRAVPYDTWADVGWFMEQHAPGSFARSIREAARKLPLLLWHNSRTFPIGVSDEWRDGEDALGCVWRMDTDDPLAVEAARKAADGLLTGLSIGFAPVGTRGEPGNDKQPAHEFTLDDNGLMWVRWVESRLLEVSLTPTPAFAGAKVTHVRSRYGAELRTAGKAPGPRHSAEIDGWRRYLEGIRR